MATAAQRPKLLAIVGPTASGKSELAMLIAKQFNGEIICADSRTIYKDMDIGTGKPSVEEQAEIPHWGLDLVKPGQVFSAAKFKNYAQAKIEEIHNRGRLPVLVGGTGLYIDGILFDFSFVDTKKLHFRHRLIYPWWSVDKLQKVIAQRDWALPENARNRRHLIAALNRRGQTGSRNYSLPEGALLIGIKPPDKVLKERIAARAARMFKQGIIEETQSLLDKYGQKALNSTGGIVYGIVACLIKGKISEQEARELFKTADWQYARRQKTWFKRNAHIKWFSSSDAAYKAAKKQLLST